MKVYVVERGCYSDRRIHGIYSTRELADAVAAKLDDSDVYEETVDADAARIPPPDHKCWEVWTTSDGDITSATVCDADYNGSFVTSIGTRYESYETMVSKGYVVRTDTLRNPTPLLVSCWARDEEHAIKIAGDKRAEWVAVELPKLVSAGKVAERAR